MKNLLNKMTQLEASAPKAAPKKKLLKESASAGIRHETSLTNLFNQLHEAMAPGQKPMPVVGKQGDTQKTGAGFININDTSPAGQAMQKALGDLAAQGKAQIVMPGTSGQTPTAAGNPNQAGATGQPQQGQIQMKEKTEQRYEVLLNNGKTQRFVAATPEEAKKKARSLNAKSLIKVTKDGFPLGKVDEADIPSTQGIDTMGANLGMGRPEKTYESKESKEHKYVVCYTTTKGDERKITITAHNIEDATKQVKKKSGFDSLDSIKKIKEEKVEEGTKGVNPFAKKDIKASTKAPAKGSKPDFLDLDKDGDKKEPMKKAAADKKKKAVKESMSHRMQAARLEGKAHGLKGHAHNGKHYDDMEESRAYHEGYKEGLDECYGMDPMIGLSNPRMPVSTRAMAQKSLENTPLDEMEDHEIEEMFSPEYDMHKKKDDFLTFPEAKSPAIRDLLNRGESDYELDKRISSGRQPDVTFAFEALDRQLNRLLSEDETPAKESVKEGLSVSISKGQQNAPDSVTITAQDTEADQLLALVKQAGLGIFGGDEISSEYGSPEIGGSSEMNASGGIEVVDDHDGMLALMKKLSGVGSDEDYADEEETCNEETCNECGGMMEADHSCGGKEVVGEEESEDQMELEVAEDNAPDSGAEDSVADEKAEAAEDEALATAGLKGGTYTVNEEDDEEDDFYEPEKITEWANDAGKNGTETTFEQGIEFMTNTISGGLNKKKSTGQTTVPVVASQNDRIFNEAINEIKRLSGLNEGKNFLNEDDNGVSTILAKIVNVLGAKDQVLPLLAARLRGQSSTVHEQQLDERRGGKVDMIVGAILGLAIAIGGNAALKIVNALGGSGYVQPHDRVCVPTGSSVTGERYDYYTSDEMRESTTSLLKRMKMITEGYAGNAALAVIQLLVDLVAMIGAEEKFINAAQSANEEVLAEGDRRSIIKALLALIFAFGLSVAAGVAERLSGGSGEFDIPAFGPNGEVVGMRSGKIHRPDEY